jgi:beta-alanine degradation protein BauB
MTTPPAEQVGTNVLFEDERVRVWSPARAPAESPTKPIHRTDCSSIVGSGGLIRFADPENAADSHDVPFNDHRVTFVPVREGKVDNRLADIREECRRNAVGLEPPRPAGSAPGRPDGP